jgi:hypothetical protein
MVILLISVAIVAYVLIGAFLLKRSIKYLPGLSDEHFILIGFSSLLWPVFIIIVGFQIIGMYAAREEKAAEFFRRERKSG